MNFILIDALKIEYDNSKDDIKDPNNLQESAVITRSAQNRMKFVRTVSVRAEAYKGVNMTSFCRWLYYWEIFNPFERVFMDW